MTETIVAQAATRNAARESWPIAGALYRHSSFCSSRMAPNRRVMASSLRKLPTTSVRRLISPFKAFQGISTVVLGQ
jgi:hypothetical protein